MGYAPAAVIDGPDRLPLPYGLFSVVSLAEAATERWENGVAWEAFGCDPVSVVVGDCNNPEGFPKQFPDGGPGIGEASAFTVYGTAKCSPTGGDITKQQDKATETLIAREQQAVEARVWRALAQDPNAVTLTSAAPLIALAKAEKWIADNYGSKGVIHVSPFAATILVKHARIGIVGGQMQTGIGTPVVVGSGYPGTGPQIEGVDEAQTITVTPDPDQVTNPSSGTFTLTFDGQTTAPIAWNAGAAAVQSALEALSNIEPGDVATSGGPLNTTPVSIAFGGQYDNANVAQVTVDDSGLVNATAATGTTTEGVPSTFTQPTAGNEFIAASPALFGYRSQVFAGTNQQGDLLDLRRNDLYGIAERNYLIGYDPCGVAFVEIDLGVGA